MHLQSLRTWMECYGIAVLYQRLALAIVAALLALYFWGNSQPEAAGLIPAPWDKLAHLGWYAALSILLLVALGRRAWPWVLAGMLLLAGWDEWHQFALPGREPGLDDWLADALGVLTGIGLHHALERRAWPFRQS